MVFRKGAGNMTYILQTNQLSKAINGKQLIEDVNIHVKKGEIYGFLGPNVLRYEQKTGSLFRYL